MTNRASTAADDMVRQGFARLTLTVEESEDLRAALSAGERFFEQPVEVKMRHSSPDLNHGYRPLGREYSVSPDRPDLNECFVIWNDRTDLFGSPEEVEYLSRAWACYRALLNPLVEQTVTALARRFGGGRAPAFVSASYLQMNNYSDPSSHRDLLQDLHEDGHMITVHYANAPGLEVSVAGQIQPVDADPDTLILMAGSVLTALADGQVEPAYHQVRNHGLSGRASIMYFVNPSLDAPVHPWSTPDDAAVDLRDAIRRKPAMFGLVDVPHL